MANTIVKYHFEVDLNFHPIRVIRFRNSDPVTFDYRILSFAEFFGFV